MPFTSLASSSEAKDSRSAQLFVSSTSAKLCRDLRTAAQILSLWDQLANTSALVSFISKCLTFWSVYKHHIAWFLGLLLSPSEQKPHSVWRIRLQQEFLCWSELYLDVVRQNWLSCFASETLTLCQHELLLSVMLRKKAFNVHSLQLDSGAALFNSSFISVHCDTFGSDYTPQWYWMYLLMFATQTTHGGKKDALAIKEWCRGHSMDGRYFSWEEWISSKKALSTRWDSMGHGSPWDNY